VTVADYFLPGSVPEALALLGVHGPELLVMAGGTVAMPLINDGISLPTQVMGLRRAGLDRMEAAGGELRIGATTTLTRLLEQGHSPMLREAARRTAGWSIRNMGTVGGNLFAPPPGGDVATALLALDSRVVLAGPRGTREVALADFWTGFMTTSMAADELATAIAVPLDEGASAFVKFGRKASNTPAVVTVAAHVVRDGSKVTRARIALGAAGPHPMRALVAESIVTGALHDEKTIAEAAEAAAAESEPFTDGIASEWYRRRMVGLFVQRALTEIARPTTGRGE
jgi:CO/xanthine dehydrogenase FAD-binding subunit